MLTKIGGHSVNPLMTFAIEPTQIKIVKHTQTSNSKEVETVEMVDGVLILGLGNSIEIQGVTVDQVQDELNAAMAATYGVPER